MLIVLKNDISKAINLPRSGALDLNNGMDIMDDYIKL